MSKASEYAKKHYEAEKAKPDLCRVGHNPGNLCIFSVDDAGDLVMVIGPETKVLTQEDALTIADWIYENFKD